VLARRSLLGALALPWTFAALAGSGGTAGNPVPAASTAPSSAVMPSIEILSTQTNLAGTCGGQSFNINTFINVDKQASAQVTVSAPGFPTLEQFTDETGSNIGPFTGTYPTFTIQAFGGGLSPNTPVRITVYTYSAPALAGTLTFSSSMQYNCTTGAILNLVSAGGPDPSAIPTLSEAGLVATSLLLALAGAVTLRRRARVTASRRRDI